MKMVLTPKQMQCIERDAMQRTGIESLLLMERAALELLRLAQGLGIRDAYVVCGPGNNGGDGLALARLLHLEGVRTQVRLLPPPDRLQGDALKNADVLRALGLALDAPWPASPPGLVVDALFGTGLSRPLTGEYLQAVQRINAYRRAGSQVLAVDIPSGVDGATGRVLGEEAVHASHCVSFQWPKRGHLFYPGRELCGQLHVVSIGLPAPKEAPQLAVLDEEDVRFLLPKRPPDAHKNRFGHGLLIAGSRGMAGAALMSAQAALSGGIGLLSCACPRHSVAPYLQAQVPAAMAYPLPETPRAGERLVPFLSGKTAAAIGPGLGRSETALSLLCAVWASSLPLVADADALNLLAQYAGEFPLRRAPLVLTPHPGEAARLLGRPVDDPVADARALAQAWQAVCLLKGATTVIAAPEGTALLNLSGCSALATGGSGDVLTGLLLSLLCQGMAPLEAAAVAAYLHGRAGERLAQEFGDRSLNAWQLAHANFFSGF